MRGAGWLALVALVVVAAPWLRGGRWRPASSATSSTSSIFTALFAALALSYDLVVGHVGSLSLAHPAFFGIGAYTAAILATRAGWPFVADLLAAVLVAGAGRRRWSACRSSVSPSTPSRSAPSASRWWPGSSPPTGWRSRAGRSASPAFPSPRSAPAADARITTLPAYYWLALAALGVVVLLYRGLTTFRLGRALPRRARQRAAGRRRPASIRCKYRMLAFTIGGALAGGIGALYAHYLSVHLPGGDDRRAHREPARHRLPRRRRQPARRAASAPCSSRRCPRCCALAPTWRLVIYGALLLVIVIRSPEGLEGLLRRRGARAAR